MTYLLLFAVCLLASAIGSIVGAGGGVIIKPVLDAIGVMPVATLSFCSGCTVLAMSLSSLIRNRGDGVKLHAKSSTALALGAVAGGLAGKWLFELVRQGFGNEAVLGAVQSGVLAAVTFATYVYICKKDSLPSKETKSPAAATVIGLCLGVISSFLGIGGGVNNVAVLFFFFSMDAKEAAKNSIFIIIFSQLASVLSAVITSSVPAFQWADMAAMAAGGVGGAILGSAVSKRLNNKGVESLLRAVALAISLLAMYNCVRYACG